MNTYQPSPDQLKARDAIGAWFRAKRPRTFGTNRPFHQAGAAGTGKTSLIPGILADNGLADDEVMLICPTGNAALVLQRKIDAYGIKTRVLTIHQLIYTPSIRTVPKTDRAGNPVVDPATKKPVEVKKLAFRRRDSEHTSLRKTRLIIVDEVSMVNDRTLHDVLELGIPTLVLGDIGQIPPVENRQHPTKTWAPFDRHRPDHMLTHIHRQAEGSNIIRLAHALLQGQRVPEGSFGDVTVVASKDFFDPSGYAADALRDADQVICSLNATRHELNRIVRGLKGYTGDIPQVGERLVCMRSNKDIVVGDLSVFSGLMVRVTNVVAYDAETVLVDVEDWDDASRTGVLELDRRILGQTLANDLMQDELAYFDYGYAITTHKAQGNQWDDLIVIDENIPGIDIKKLRYTAVTRAARRLIYVK